MKKTLTLTLLAVLLTACAAPTPTPTMTQSSTVPPSEVTATSILDVALMATPTEAAPAAGEVIQTESAINWEYYEKHKLPIIESFVAPDNVRTEVDFGFDESISSLVKTSVLRDGTWTTKDGSTPELAAHSYTKRMFYETWVDYQKSISSGLESTSYETWISWLADAQASNTAEAWSKVVTAIKVDNKVDGNYTLTKVLVAPMAGEDSVLPDGVSKAQKVAYVVVSGNKYSESMKVNPSGYGMGSELLSNGTLLLKISPSTLNTDTFWSADITAAMSTGGRYLSTGLLSTTVDKTAMECLGVQVGRDRWQSFFKITPATENEKTFNS